MHLFAENFVVIAILLMNPPCSFKHPMRNCTVEILKLQINEMAQIWRFVYIADNVLSPGSGPRYMIAVSQGVLLGCFSLLFILNILTAIQAARCILSNYVSMNMKVGKGLILQSR